MLLGGASTWADTFTKITSTSELVAGEEYIFVYETDNVAMGTLTTSGTTYGPTVDVTITSNSTTPGSDVNILTLGGDAEGWTFYTSKESKYISWSSGNSLTTAASVTNASKWTISISSGTATIANVGDSSRKLQYNANNPRFACYTSAQKSIQIYKKDAPIAVTGVSLNKTETSIEAGNTETLTATVAPAAASNKNVTWTTDASAVATVSNGVVTAIAPGTAHITATTEDGGFKATCTVTVTAPVAPSVTLSTTDVNVDAEEHDGAITVGYYNFSDIAADIAYFEADGTTPADASDYDWLLASINASNNVEYVIDANTSKSARSAYFKVYALDDEANEVYSDLITITQAGLDYVTLPFSWAGGTKTNLTNIAGVRGTGLGSDYADTHAPYYVKLDNTGDYIQIKTNAQPGKVTIGVKMIGGATASSITVEASADGESYRDIQTLSISGAQNTILTLETTKAFAPTDRYVRLVFTKGANVGVGPITIVGCAPVTVSAAGFATFCTANALDFSDAIEGVTAYTASLEGDVVSFNEISTDIPANTGILLKAAAGTYYLPFAISSSTDVSGNKLVGVTEETVIGKSSAKGTHYVLKQNAEGVGFYQVNNDKYKVRANSAYLALTVGTPAKGFIPVDGTTAIELVDTANEVAAPAYNLQGQRVSNGYKGVVIVNGKKIMMK